MSCKHKIYPYEMEFLPEEHLQVAQRELNETPTKRIQLLRDLKSMAKDHKTLNDLDLHPDFLLQFLRVSKFNIDVAFARLQKYINFRRKYPSYFTGVQDRISSSPSYRWMSPLPWRSSEGCAITVMKLGEWDSRCISYENLIRMCHLAMHQSLRDPATQINGIILILDYEGTSFRHLQYGTPANLYQTTQMFLECCPARFKQFHCVNCTWAMKIAWSIIAPFLSEKLRDRVIFHKQPEDLLEYFPKHTLPTMYGGDIEDFYMQSWMKEANYQIGISTLEGQPNIY